MGLLGATAAFAGVWGAVPAYVADAGAEHTVTVVSARREVVGHSGAARSAGTLRSSSVARVRVDGQAGTRTAYLRGPNLVTTVGR